MSTSFSEPTVLASITSLETVRSGRRKRSYCRLSQDTRIRVTNRLLAQEVRNGGLTKADYKREAVKCGASASQLEKLVRAAKLARLAGGAAVPPARVERTSKVVITDEVLLCHVGRDVMHGMLDALGKGLIEPCAYSTYREALLKHAGRDVILGLQRGERHMSKQWIYLDRRDNPLLDVITIDLFFPSVRVLNAAGLEVEPVWVCVRERATGMILAWHQFPDRPGITGRQLLALLGRAMRGFHYQGVFIGGVPRAVRCDREAVFLTPANQASLAAAGVELDPTNSYSSWENGAHERMHESIRRDALDGLRAYKRGPENRDESQTFQNVQTTLPELSGLLARWVSYNNFTWRPAGLDGQTRLERWMERLEAGDVVERADGATLADLALPAGTARKGKHGVTLPDTGESYSGAVLMDTLARDLELRTWPGESETVEAFDALNSTWIGTLHRRATMPAAEEAAILRRRSTGRRTVKDLMQRAGALAAVADGPTPPPHAPATDYPEPEPAEPGAEEAQPSAPARPATAEPASAASAMPDELFAGLDERLRAAAEAVAAMPVEDLT